MNEKINSILSDVAVDTLEQLAFMFAFPEEARGGIDFNAVICAYVSFTGSLSGRLNILVSSQVLDELTVNMLGIDEDEDVSEEQKHDALREMVNVICGNLLPELGGKQAINNVDHPEVISESEAIKEAVCKDFSAVARLEIDEELFALFLSIDGEITLDNN